MQISDFEVWIRQKIVDVKCNFSVCFVNKLAFISTHAELQHELETPEFTLKKGNQKQQNLTYEIINFQN